MLNEKIYNGDFNAEEIKFLLNYSKFFFKNNNEFLNFELDTNISEYIKLKSSLLVEQTKKLEHIDEASSLFIDYLKNKKRIIFITDSDLDGTCCRALLHSKDIYLKRKFGYKHIFEHYFAIGHTHGITFEHVDKLLKNDTDSEALIVTADNGINSKEEITLIKEKYPNIRIIITDHHLSNEGEGVYDLVDYVLDPEAIDYNTKSCITKVEFNGQIVDTSYSGAHVLFLFLKNTLEILGITDEELLNEMTLIALYSDIGDIINFGPDVFNLFTQNIDNFNNFFFVQKFKDNLDFFNQFPEEFFDYKLSEYISKTITNLNSTRRTNSILFNFNHLSKEEFSLWMKEKFDFDINNDKIITDKKNNSEEDLYKVLSNLNKSAKRIYDYFSEEWDCPFVVDEKDKFNYSFIKEIVPFLLLSNNSHKEKNDTLFVQECFAIVEKMNLVKNGLRQFIVDRDLYIHKKFDFFECFVSKKDAILREILSIQAFVDAHPLKSFLTLAKTSNNEIKGSMRSKNISFKEILLYDNSYKDIIDKYGYDIEILGHDAAAGIFFRRENIDLEEFFMFLEEIKHRLISNGFSKPEYDRNTIDLSLFEKIDSIKILEFIKNNMMLAPHSFIDKYYITFKGEDLIKLFEKKLFIKSSASGTRYLNFKDNNNNTFLYFPKEEELDIYKEAYYKANVDFKYAANLDKVFFEIMFSKEED